MNYGNLVRRPFEIVARRPYLWLLGILAGGATSWNFSSNYRYGSNANPRPAGETGPTWAQVQAFWNGNWEWLVGIAAVLVVIGAVMFVLSCIATGAIVNAAVEHDAGRDYRLGVAWRSGYRSGWRIAGLKVLVFLLAVVPALLIGSLVVAAVAGGANGVIGAAVAFGFTAFLALMVGIAFWLALSVSYQLAQRMIVLEDRKVAESLSLGFRMIVWHFGSVALGWLILVGISILAGIAALVVFGVIAVSAAAVGFGGFLAGGFIGAVVAGATAGVFAVGAILAVFGAYAAYSSVYWTLFFQRLRGLPAPAVQGTPVPAA